MVNGGSLPSTATVVFDLKTQVGIADLLRSIKASDLSSNHKAELRDLVFSYVSGGREVSAGLALEQKISASALAKVPNATTSAKVAVVVNTFPPRTIGTYRVAPSFKAPTFEEPEPAGPVYTKITAPDPLPDSPSIPPEPVIPSVLDFVAPTPVVSVPTPLDVPPAPQPVSVLSEQINLADNDTYLNRIREIKALINEKVGNPVNLVEMDNTVGREYMTALLDAMKKINSGSSAGSAMARLEAAYTAAVQLLENGPTAPAGVISVPDVTVVPPVPQYVPPPQPEPMPEPVRAVVPPPPTKEEFFVPEPLPTIPKTGRLPVTSAEPTYTPPAPPISMRPLAQPMPAPVVTPVPILEPLGEAAPVYPSTQSFSPLSESPIKLKTPQSLPDKISADPNNFGDPLQNKEVDDGLEQLLEEWGIFKKSGIFGTGPKGREHPLFKKISSLQIPLLLAGRFEGATQEIRQSITDYMNGWRYEQGIVYQQNESFEHYLRRVIRHILDLQNN